MLRGAIVAIIVHAGQRPQQAIVTLKKRSVGATSRHARLAPGCRKSAPGWSVRHDAGVLRGRERI